MSCQETIKSYFSLKKFSSNLIICVIPVRVWYSLSGENAAIDCNEFRGCFQFFGEEDLWLLGLHLIALSLEQE